MTEFGTNLPPWMSMDETDTDTPFYNKEKRYFDDPKWFRIKKTNYTNGECKASAFKMSSNGQYLHITQIGWKYLHFEFCNKVSDFLFEFLKKSNHEIKDVVLVGGMGQSQILKHWLKRDFARIKFHSPKASHLACVEGALFWLCQKTRGNDIEAKYSFGLAFDRAYNRDIDRSQERYKIGDTLSPTGFTVTTAIEWFIQVNEIYSLTFKKYIDKFGIRKTIDVLDINLYATVNETARYCNDKGVVLVKQEKIDVTKVLANMDAVKHDETNPSDDSIVRISFEFEFGDQTMFLYVCDEEHKRITEAIQIEDDEIWKMILLNKA